MIKSFKDKRTEALYKREYAPRFPVTLARSAAKKLWVLDFVLNLNDLRVPPSNHLEALNGDREGQYSIRINRQWRICFVWYEGHAHHVEVVDYH